VLPNLVYSSRGLESDIEDMEQAKVNGLEVSPRVWNRLMIQITQHVSGRKEKKLCPPHILKFYAEREANKEYSKRLIDAVDAATGHGKKKLNREDVRKLLNKSGFKDLLFKVPEKSMMKTFERDKPPEGIVA